MTLTTDERRALGLVAVLFAASAIARLWTPDPAPLTLRGAQQIDLAAQEHAVQANIAERARHGGRARAPSRAPAPPRAPSRAPARRRATAPPRAPARSRATPAPTPRPAPAPVSINHATAAELERLSGIGPTLAARIVAYRKEHGYFATVDDLVKVRGIGPKLLERLRPQVRP